MTSNTSLPKCMLDCTHPPFTRSHITLTLQVCVLPQSCLTCCNPMDRSLPGSSVQGILQARILEWVVMPSSMGSSRPRYQTCISYVSCIGKFFTTSANWEAQYLFNTNLTFLCFCSCYFTNLNTHSPHCLPKF